VSGVANIDPITGNYLQSGPLEHRLYVSPNPQEVSSSLQGENPIKSYENNSSVKKNVTYVSKNNSTRYFGKFTGTLGDLAKAAWKHKGKIVTGLVEGLGLLYANALGHVASNPYVENGLNIGKIIKYPVRPEIGFLPHLVELSRQPGLDPIYETETDLVKYFFLKYIGQACKDPGVMILLASIPVGLYGLYRLWKHYKGDGK